MEKHGNKDCDRFMAMKTGERAYKKEWRRREVKKDRIGKGKI